MHTSKCCVPNMYWYKVSISLDNLNFCTRCGTDIVFSLSICWVFQLILCPIWCCKLRVYFYHLELHVQNWTCFLRILFLAWLKRNMFFFSQNHLDMRCMGPLHKWCCNSFGCLLQIGLQGCTRAPRSSLEKRKLKCTHRKSSFTWCASTKIRCPRVRWAYIQRLRKNLLALENCSICLKYSHIHHYGNALTNPLLEPMRWMWASF